MIFKRIWLVFILFFIGCSSTIFVPVKVFQPSEVNILSKNKVIVGEFEGEGGDAIESSLKEKISTSEILILVDRKYTDSVVKEQSFSNSDLTKNNKRVSLGKMENAQTLISGKVRSYELNEDVAETKKKCFDKSYFKSCNNNSEEKCELQSKNYCQSADDQEDCEEKYIEVCEEDIEKECKDKANRDCVEYLRIVTSDVEVSFNLIDIESGVNIITKVFNSHKQEEKKSIDEQPAKVNGSEMLRSSVSEIIDKYMKVIAPYTVDENVVLFLDKKLPMLEQGISFVKAGEWKEAEKVFKMAVDKVESIPDISNETAAKPHWNLAMVYKYTDLFDKSLAQISKGYKISGKSMYLEEMKNIKKRKETLDRFKSKSDKKDE